MSLEAGMIWVLKNLWLLVMFAFGWIFKKHEETITQLKEQIAVLEKAQRDFITDVEAKRIVMEIIEPIRMEQQEVKSNVKDILIAVHEIQKTLAVQAAVYKLQHEKEDN